MSDGNNVQKLDPREFRNCCGRFATGVTVVTGTLGDGSLMGVTANSFSSVSLDPALVLFCLDKKALSFDGFALASHFAFNILSEAQQDISNIFAMTGIDKFADTAFDLNEHGVPILKGCLATLECRMYAIHDGGDHQIIVGQVYRIRTNDLAEDETGKPLLYFAGNYGALK